MGMVLAKLRLLAELARLDQELARLEKELVLLDQELVRLEAEEQLPEDTASPVHQPPYGWR